MFSNERRSPYVRQPHQTQGYQPTPRPFVQEDTLKTAELQIERKFFTFTLKENPRGRFLRITEEIGGKRNTIIIPTTGLDDFERVVKEMVKSDKEMPAPKKSPAVEPSEVDGNR